MADESLSASTVIEARPEAIFAVLADPTTHAAIDGTGWVGEALDEFSLRATGQIFRMSMYHPNHPDGTYEMANRVQVYDPPNAIAWEPGSDAGDGTLSFGGWIWRYELRPAGSSSTTVTLTYDWSAVPEPVRQHIGFPPFPPEHLDNSLFHLSRLVVS